MHHPVTAIANNTNSSTQFSKKNGFIVNLITIEIHSTVTFSIKKKIWATMSLSKMEAVAVVEKNGTCRCSASSERFLLALSYYGNRIDK